MSKRENVRNIDNEVIKLIITDQTFLDVLLIKIRGRLISFAAFKKKKRNKQKGKSSEKMSSTWNKIEQNVI